jgi:hypothetical protein
MALYPCFVELASLNGRLHCRFMLFDPNQEQRLLHDDAPYQLAS